jgi:hypothetical protein
MPLWIVYHPSTTFQTEEEKGAFSKDVTQIYTSVGLPAFYVVVNFIKLEEGETWVGGEKRTAKPFVRKGPSILVSHHTSEMHQR